MSKRDGGAAWTAPPSRLLILPGEPEPLSDLLPHRQLLHLARDAAFDGLDQVWPESGRWNDIIHGADALGAQDVVRMIELAGDLANFLGAHLLHDAVQLGAQDRLLRVIGLRQSLLQFLDAR